MKRIVFLLLLTGALSLTGYAQQSVSIGTDQINSNAVLWLQGNGSQGLILPVVTNRSNVTATKGMVVFDDSDKKVYYNSGTAWVEVGGGGTGTAQTLTITGNTLSISSGNSVQIAGTAPTVAGQLLQWNGSQWTSSNATAPASGQVLKWNGTSWAPAADDTAGGFPNLTNGQILIGDGVANSAAALSGDATLNGAVITISNNAINSAKIADGTILGTDMNAMSATNGQVLKFNGTTWAPAADNEGGGATPTLGNGQILTGDGTTNTASTLSGDATLNGGTLTIANNAINSAKIADGSVTSTDITDGTVSSTDIADGTILPADLNSMGATNGQVLQFNGTLWNPVTLAGGGTVTSVSGTGPILVNTPTTTPVISILQANGTTNGFISSVDWAAFNSKLGAASTTGGDLSGTVISPTVVGIQGRAVANTVPTNGQILKFNGTSWAPAADDVGGGATPTLSNGQILIGDGTNNSGVALSGDATLSAGALTIANNAINSAKIADGSVQAADLNAMGATANQVLQYNGTNWAPALLPVSTGTVSSVGLTLPTIFSVTGSPVTTSGTLAATLSSQTAGTVFAAPAGSAGAPSFRALTATDIPGLDVAKITTGILPITQGGTGANSPAGALTNLGAMNNTLNAGEIFVGSATNIATGVAVSGDATLSTAGTLTVVNNAINSAKIADGSIVDSDVNAAAAIAGTKINPDFGAQNVLTTGSGAFSQLILSNELRLGADPGTAGQVLTSAGPGAVPTWSTGGAAFNTLNVIPKGDGTTLIASNIFDDGTNVGIGTTTPGTNLEVFAANPTLRMHSSGNSSTIEFINAGSGNIGSIGDPGSSEDLQIAATNRLFFNTNFATRMAIDAAGSVGIGTITPTQPLDLVGNFRLSGGIIPANSNLFFSGGNSITSGVGNFGWGGGTGITTGSYNVILGNNAGFNLQGGGANIFMGVNSGQSIVSTDGNVFIGPDASPLATGTDNVGIGHAANVAAGINNATAIGAGAQVTTSNRLVLGAPGVDVQFDGELRPADNPGTAGQVLTSQGPGSTPIWAPGGGGSLQSAYTGGNTITLGVSPIAITGTGGQAAIRVNDSYIESVDSGDDEDAWFRSTSGTSWLFGANNQVHSGGFGIGTFGNMLIPPFFIEPVSGFVGIGGEVSPSAALDVVGDVEFSGALLPNNLPGNVGDVLVSNGAGSPPVWSAPGSSSLLRNNGVQTIFVGFEAGINNSDASGFNNSFVGHRAGYSNTTGTDNTFIGAQAGTATVGGGYNVFVGRYAGNANISGGLNTYVGYNAGILATGDGNSLIGGESGFATTTGFLNTFVGEKSGRANTTGYENVFVGRQSGNTNIDGFQNTTIGTDADVSSGSLINATAIGARSLVSQSHSLVLGSINGINGSFNDTNVGIGTTAPSRKLEVSSAADARIRVTTTTATSQAGIEMIDGTSSWRLTTNALTGGARMDESTDAFAANSNLRFQFSSAALEPGASGTQDLGSTIYRWSTLFATNGTINTSDRRLKKDERALQYGLHEILKLEPVSFKWKNENTDVRTHLGLMAQDVLKIIPEAVIIGEDEQKTLGLSYSDLVPVLIKSVQELNSKLEALQEENLLLKSEKGSLESKVSAIEAQQQELAKSLEEIKRLLGAEAKK